MKHVVAIATVEAVILTLFAVTWFTGPRLTGTRGIVAWLIAGGVVGLGARYPRRWWEERSRERSHSR